MKYLPGKDDPLAIKVNDCFYNDHWISVDPVLNLMSDHVGEWKLTDSYSGARGDEYTYYPTRAEACEAAYKFVHSLQNSPLDIKDAEKLAQEIQDTARARKSLTDACLALNNRIVDLTDSEELTLHVDYIVHEIDKAMLAADDYAKEDWMCQNLVTRLMYKDHPSFNNIPKVKP